MIQPSNDVLFEENLSKVNIHRPSRRRRTSAVALGQKSRLRARTRRRMIFILSLRRIWVYGTGDRTPRRQTVRVRRQTREIRFARTLRDNMEICYTSRRENTKNEKHLIVEKTGPTSLFSMEVTLHDGCVRVAGCLLGPWSHSREQVAVGMSGVFLFKVVTPDSHDHDFLDRWLRHSTRAFLALPEQLRMILRKKHSIVEHWLGAPKCPSNGLPIWRKFGNRCCHKCQIGSLINRTPKKRPKPCRPLVIIELGESACGSRFETNLSVSSTIVGRGIWTVGKIDFHDPMAIIRGSILRT
ncbi:unnamed protein product, partial [Nesidiocoris tenuis]